TALRTVRYQNTSENPSTLTRTVSFQVNDGSPSNNLSNVATRTITVTAVNDPPVLAGIETNALVYTENDPATVITATITTSDPDNTTLTGATIAIAANYVSGEDILGFTNQSGITGNFDGGTGVLTLSGAATLANYQNALQTIRYQNTSDNPTTLTRTVTFQVNDGSANNFLSNIITRNIAITAVNDPPVLAGIEGTALAYTENDPATPITVTLTTADVDNNNLTGATVSIS